MDQETPQKPDIKPEVNQNVKKRGWLANLLSFLGFSGGAGGVGGSITAASGVGSGLFGGLLGGGIMATKAGMIALALAGATVVGGLGVLGYKMLANPNASGKGGGDQFNSLFAAKPKDTGMAQSSGQPAAAGGGVKNSLDYLAQANQGAESEGNKTEEAKATETEDKTADAAAEQAPVNPMAAMNNANAPTAGQAASFHGKGIKSDSKFGQLATGMGGGSSGASFSTAMKAAPPASNPLLAAGRTDSSSAMRGQGRSVVGGRRNESKNREKNAGRQLKGLNNMTKNLGAGNAGLKTFDGGTGGTGISGAEASDVGAAPSGQSGIPDRSVNPTPFSQKELNEVETPKGRDVTPWAKTIDKAKMMMMISVVGLFLAIMLLQQYYESWVAAYNAQWQAANYGGLQAGHTSCQAKMISMLGTGGPCATAAGTVIVTAINKVKIGIIDAPITKMMEKSAAKFAATQAKGAATTTGTFGGMMAAGITVPGSVSENTAEQLAWRAKVLTAIPTMVSTGATAGIGTTAACCTTQCGTTCTGTGPAIAACLPPCKVACNSLAKTAITTATKAYGACMKLITSTSEAEAIGIASEAAEGASIGWKAAGIALGIAAMAAGAMTTKLGMDMKKGEYKQESQGNMFMVGGALLTGVSGWFLLKAKMPAITQETAGAFSGELKAETASSMASFSTMPAIMKFAGVAAIGAGASAMMSKPTTTNCKTDAECKKIIDDTNGASNLRKTPLDYPSERELEKYLT